MMHTWPVKEDLSWQPLDDNLRTVHCASPKLINQWAQFRFKANAMDEITMMFIKVNIKYIIIHITISLWMSPLPNPHQVLRKISTPHIGNRPGVTARWSFIVSASVSGRLRKRMASICKKRSLEKGETVKHFGETYFLLQCIGV